MRTMPLGAGGRDFIGDLSQFYISATAWSFDRLRFWIESGIHLRQSMQFSAIAVVARIATAFTWIGQGSMPKLLFPSVDKRLLMRVAGGPEDLLAWVGAAKVLFGIGTLWPRDGVFLLNAMFVVVTLAPVDFTASQYLRAAFNPVTLNAGMPALSIVGLLAAREAPSVAAAAVLRRVPNNAIRCAGRRSALLCREAAFADSTPL